MKPTILVSLLSFLLLSACNEGVLVDEFHDIPKGNWTYDQPIVDSFEVEKVHHYHQLYANLRINADYAYSNINLKLTITDPEGKATEDIVSLLLAEKSGKWLGSGLGSTLTYQSPILGKKEFKLKGLYTVKIEQYMRIENLPNVQSVGLLVKELEEIY